jgi:hypothetical protein
MELGRLLRAKAALLHLSMSSATPFVCARARAAVGEARAQLTVACKLKVARTGRSPRDSNVSN